MRFLGASLLVLAAVTPTIHATEAADAGPARAFQDHIAYVATFAMPVLIEKCGARDATYVARAAPLYFRFVNARQDQIERGRLLTLAELPATDTLAAYRARTLAQRLGRLDTGTAEEKQRMCEGALAMLGGRIIPGEWPPRE